MKCTDEEWRTCDVEKRGCEGCFFFDNRTKFKTVTEFTIPGKPQAKQRPRFNRYSGRAYTPKQTVNYENWVKECYMSQKDKGTKTIENPIVVDITMYVAIPQSKSKRQKKKMLEGEIQPSVKPDVDNIAKTILDALNGIAYVDDKQVIELKIKKKYSESYWTEVKIKELKV